MRWVAPVRPIVGFDFVDDAFFGELADHLHELLRARRTVAHPSVEPIVKPQDDRAVRVNLAVGADDRVVPRVREDGKARIGVENAEFTRSLGDPRDAAHSAFANLVLQLEDSEFGIEMRAVDEIDGIGR